MHPITYNAKAYSAASETSPLASTKIKRREPTDRDVQIEILFCGICHSDLHFADGTYPYPLPYVPGHESSGIVEQVGEDVTHVRPGDGAIAVEIENALPKP